MPKEIRLWKVTDEGFEELEQNMIGREEKLHDWLEQDASLISDDLLVIGREVSTGFGKSIDLLCLNSAGDVVMIELKRDKAPRDVMAQILEYASWVDDLPSERILEIANDYLQKKGMSLEDAFQQKFKTPRPEYLNESHKMLIVTSELDAQTERVLTYLSEHEIDINAVTFSYFRNGNNEYMARILLIPESMKEITRGLTKKVPEPLWTLDLLKERLEQIRNETLRMRLSETLNLAVRNNIFAKSRSKDPQFCLSVKSTGGKAFSVSLNGILYAYFGLNEVKKYPTNEARQRFINDLKRLNLLPQDINPADVKSGKILEKRLDELTDSEFAELLKSLERDLTV